MPVSSRNLAETGYLQFARGEGLCALVQRWCAAGRNMSSKRDPSRPRVNEEAAGILRAAAKVAEERIRKRFPEKRRVQ